MAISFFSFKILIIILVLFGPKILWVSLLKVEKQYINKNTKINLGLTSIFEEASIRVTATELEFTAT